MTDRYSSMAEMMKVVKAEDITSYADLLKYANENGKEYWKKHLWNGQMNNGIRNTGKYVISLYIESNNRRKRHV